MSHPTLSISRQPVTDSIEKIFRVICLYQDSIQAPGLLSGHLGTALFYCLYAQHSHRQECIGLAKNRLEKAVKLLASQPDLTHSGLNDLSQVAHYLNSAGMISHSSEKRFSGLDGLLLKKMRGALQNGHIGGFSYGAISYGLHFLNRASLHPRRYKRIISELITSLKTSAVSGPAACHWCYNQQYSSTLWNGQAAVILFLTRATELGLAGKSEISDMLGKAVTFILHQHRQQISTELLSVQMGDLGTGYALLRAGQTFGNESWQTAGLQILGARAGKTLAITNQDLPLGILNGAAGAAVVFEKIYKLTANSLFSQASQRSYAILLSARMPEHTDPELSLSRTELSFGTGICGMGASMIQMLNSQKVDLQPILWLI